jgi:hypothetical protein
MIRPRGTVLFAFSCVLAAPLLAQPQIGGGTCSSATLTGTYAFSLTGRQITSSGNFKSVFQGNGSANFDGLSKVTITLTSDTIASVATPLNWSGTYSMQANCAGVVSITSGGSATLNVVSYAQGVDFLVTGNDATYSYSGSGNTQPSSCATSTVSGVYTFTGTGYNLGSGSVISAGVVSGLLQFDGISNITANVTLASSGESQAVSVTGSYSVSSNCVGSATFTNSKGTIVMALSVTNATSLYSSDLYVTIASSGTFLLSGSAHAIYGQPTVATPEDRASGKGARI